MYSQFINLTSQKLAKGPSLRKMVLLSNAYNSLHEDQQLNGYRENFRASTSSESIEDQNEMEEKWLDGVLEEMIHQEEVEEEEVWEEEVGDQTGFGEEGDDSHHLPHHRHNRDSNSLSHDYINVSFRPQHQTSYIPSSPKGSTSSFLDISIFQSDMDDEFEEEENGAGLFSSPPNTPEQGYLSELREEEEEESGKRRKMDLFPKIIPISIPLPDSPPQEEDCPELSPEIFSSELGFKNLMNSSGSNNFESSERRLSGSSNFGDFFNSSQDSLPETIDESVMVRQGRELMMRIEGIGKGKDGGDEERRFGELPFEGEVFEIDASDEEDEKEEEEERGRRGWRKGKEELDLDRLNEKLKEASISTQQHQHSIVQPWFIKDPSETTSPSNNPTFSFPNFTLLHYHPFVPPTSPSPSPLNSSSSSSNKPSRTSLSPSPTSRPYPPPPPPPPPPSFPSLPLPLKLKLRQTFPPLAPPPPPIPVWCMRGRKRDGFVGVGVIDDGEGGGLVEEGERRDGKDVGLAYDMIDVGEARGWFLRA